MKYLTENAEEKIKQMDFCSIEGFDEDRDGVCTIEEVIDRYLENCEDEEIKPQSIIRIDLLKYFPFPKYEKGICFYDLIERFDDEYKEEYTSLHTFPDEVFELEEKLYELITKNYHRYFGEIFTTIEVDISDEIERW